MTLRIGLAEPESFDPVVSRRVPRQLKHFNVSTEVSFVQDEPNRRTEMRLRASDRPGLLCRVGQVFAELGIRLHNAKITTLGAVAEDTFFVTNRKNEALTDQLLLARLTAALRERLDH